MKTKNIIWLIPLIVMGLGLVLTNSCEKDDPVIITVTDIDGNDYTSVIIGTQEWMVENLKTTKYRNGDLIGTTNPYDKDIMQEDTPKYQWAYDGNESHVATFGRLYTWYSATDSRNICPTGWHVPTDAEWTTLTDYLTSNGYGYEGNGPDIAKSMAAKSSWTENATAGTVGNDRASNNSSGFTALPCGGRIGAGLFSSIGDVGIWCSSTKYGYTNSYVRYIVSNKNYVESIEVADNRNGFSVRCVRD